MCQIISKHDVALSLSRLTGKGYENSLLDMIRLDKPSAFTSWGNFDAKGFKRLAQSEGVSDSNIVREVSKLTGDGFENSFLKLNMITPVPLKGTRPNLNRFDNPILFPSRDDFDVDDFKKTARSEDDSDSSITKEVGIRTAGSSESSLSKLIKGTWFERMWDDSGK